MICPSCGTENSSGARVCKRCGRRFADARSAGRASGSFGKIGPYELRGELGQGAMARVWRAWDPNLQREVAIKEPVFAAGLSPQILDQMGKRFVAEGRAAGRLNHPNIVTIYSADVYAGRPAIVMELIDGSTLGSFLARSRLSPAQALSVLDQLLDAMGYAHSRGIVHRDIKPDNIFITREGRVKLADFGIAHIDSAGTTHATVAGAVLGSPGYMSPEQAAGLPVDARSDIFSAGIVAYEMLSGRNPFGLSEGGDSMSLLYRIVNEQPAPLPASAVAGLAFDIRPAIMSALAKDPAARPQSAEAFRAMLRGSVSASPQAALARRVSANIDGRSAGLPNISKEDVNKWLPYIALGGVGLLLLMLLFMGV